MFLNELLPALRGLNRADKFQVVQLLLSELAKEDNVLLVPDAEYPVWSPYDATEAGNTLLKMLHDHAEG